VPLDPGIDRYLSLVDENPAAQEIDDSRQDGAEDEGKIDELLEGFEKGILEEIKADIPPEYRIVLTDVQGVGEQQDFGPQGGAPFSHHECYDQEDEEGNRPLDGP